MAQEQASVAIVMRGRDEASPAIRQVGQAAQTTGQQFAQTGAQAVSMGSQVRTALPSLATLGSSMASLLITTGALNSETGRFVTIGLSIASAAASAGPAILLLVNAFRSLAIAQRAVAVTQAVLLGLSGVGLPLVAAGLAAGAAVAGGIVLLNRAGASGRQQPGSVTIINNGPVLGNDRDVRTLADQVGLVIAENQRLGIR